MSFKDRRGALTPIDTQGRSHPTQVLPEGGQFTVQASVLTATQPTILAAPGSGFNFNPIYRLHSITSPDIPAGGLLAFVDGNGNFIAIRERDSDVLLRRPRPGDVDWRFQRLPGNVPRVAYLGHDRYPGHHSLEHGRGDQWHDDATAKAVS